MVIVTGDRAAARIWRRPGIPLLTAGVVVTGLAFVPDVLLTLHLSGGGWFGAVGAAVVNRLSMTLTVLGCTLLVGGLVVASTSRQSSSRG
ncbi:hypothetical protein [Cellulomonas sp. IC4_254]|uniref:hypothetical protein n=1 Tax=Cellulomonas sp. IC4_254 TaxID=2714040 RepID=UPI001424213D|nr:hypothetical protein [Cellulomonas sp. IC4_254]NHT16757.1 hypothetical protein [Cellulomonas sp. IC4_254]